MKKMRKKYVLIISMVLFAMILTGCSNVRNKKDDKIQVVCTLFPQYDWAREIIGDNGNVEIILLCDSGSDLHSFQPTADDIITISDCDIFVYGGGVSDKWVEDTLKQATNKDMIVINMMELIGDNAKKEEIVEGMEAHEHQHDEHEQDDSEHHQHEHEEHEFDASGYDEHLWLSIINAQLVCDEICQALCKVDAENEEKYQSNLTVYKDKLTDLDSRYREMVEDAKLDTILVADRFPFRYLTSEYGIKYYAAFVGCSSETEASFETVTFLAGKMDELKLNTVIVVDGSTQDVAKTVIECSANKNQSILELDSMQAVSKNRIDAGDSYISIMENNLQVLSQALNN